MSEKGIITELQIGWGWKYLWKSSGPTAQIDLVGPELVTWSHAQMSFEYLQGWILHSLPGKSVLFLCYPLRDKLLSDVQTSAFVFHLAPIASCPITGHH